jgi:NAD(P)-dependent dehydrogenase (short-subunit alcohol dehydrogenase family)
LDPSLTAEQILIITGSASGIGLAAAKLALDEGASVLGVDIVASPSSLTGHPNYKFLQGNLCHERTPKDVVQACIEAFGGQIDGLLNVAGVMDANQSVDSLSDEIWERCISVNLTAPVKLMREVIVIMQQQKSGNIVNIASKAALSGAVAGVAYTASGYPL